MRVIGLKCTPYQTRFMQSSTVLKPKCKLKIPSQTEIDLLIKDIVFSLFGRKCKVNKKRQSNLNRYIIIRQEQYLIRTSSFVRSNCQGGLTSNSFIPYEPICHIKLSFLPRQQDALSSTIYCSLTISTVQQCRARETQG